MDTAAPQYHLFVLALSRQVTLTALVDALAAQLGPLQMLEVVTVPPVPEPPAPWWHGLKADDKVKALRDGVPVVTAGGALALRGRAGAVWDVWEPAVNIEREQVCIYNGDAKRYAGGLWVAASDIEPAG